MAKCFYYASVTRMIPISAAPLGNTGQVQVQCTIAPNKWDIPQDLTTTAKNSRFNDYTDEFSMKYAQKLRTVSYDLVKVTEDPSQSLALVDAIQRLGIDNHFQEEIEAVLSRQPFAAKTCLHTYETLHEVSLHFRLLRQEGYNVPADVFDHFKDKEGTFKGKLKEDIRGLMELHEAAQLSLEGEDMLDEAATFSSQALKKWLKYLDPSWARIVNNTLRHPYHKSIARFTAKDFSRDFKGKNRWLDNLQELSNMDFYRAQRTHQKELLEISSWWKNLGLAKELKLLRDQPLKWYTWPMAILTDPSLSDERIDLAKSITMIYVVDDIFDLYGTLDELTLFTEAVNSCQFAAIEKLPDRMKMCFRALHDITYELGYSIYQKHGWNPVQSLWKTWSSLCNAFLAEAKWFASGDLPKADEYLKNGTVSSGVHVVLVHVFFLLGFGASTECPMNLDDISAMIHSVAAILRLRDDLGSAKDEGQEGEDGSYLECYMKEHKGISAEVAREHVFTLISDEWKRLNKHCHLNRVAVPFRKASLNLARMIPLMYSYDDNQRLPVLEDYVKTMLYENSSLEPYEILRK